jgi:hypothetical protein
MQSSLLTQLRDTFHQLQSARVCTTVLWVLAEYSKEVEEISAAMDVIMASMGPMPFAKDAGVCLVLLRPAEVVGSSVPTGVGGGGGGEGLPARPSCVGGMLSSAVLSLLSLVGAGSSNFLGAVAFVRCCPSHTADVCLVLWNFRISVMA